MELGFTQSVEAFASVAFAVMCAGAMFWAVVW